ncbi:MAG: Hint domain-containing protein [Verrucomicrobiota bacterium]
MTRPRHISLSQLRKLRSALLAGGLLPLVILTTSCGLVGATLNTAIALAPLKLMFMCIPEGTQIDTPDGPKAIEIIKAGDKVIGYSGDAVKVLQIHSYMEDEHSDEFLEITFADGAVVNCCTKHRICGVRAGNLKAGDTVVSGQVVVKTKRYAGVERSYDLLTEDSGYRIGGVPVNSMINEMYQTGRTGKMRD